MRSGTRFTPKAKKTKKTGEKKTKTEFLDLDGALKRLTHLSHSCREQLEEEKKLLAAEKNQLEELKRTYERSFVLSDSESGEEKKRVRFNDLVLFDETSGFFFCFFFFSFFFFFFVAHFRTPWGVWMGYELTVKKGEKLTAVMVESLSASHKIAVNGKEVAIEVRPM
jgi:hypothetical protein